MDEMKIESKFTTAIIGKILKHVVKKKLGHEVEVVLNRFSITITDDVAHLHVEADAMMDKHDFSKMIEDAIL